MIGAILRTLGESLSELRARVSNVRYGPLGEILFEFDDKTMSAPEPMDIMPVGNGEASKAWAVRMILDKKAK